MVTNPFDWLDLQEHYPVWAHVAWRTGVLVSRLYAYYKRCVQEEKGMSSTGADETHTAAAAELPVNEAAEGGEDEGCPLHVAL
jgi:hypothetical protein